MKELEPLLDAQDVKKILRCSLPFVYKLAAQGRIPCVRIPCQGLGTRKERFTVRFKKEDVLSFVDKHYETT